MASADQIKALLKSHIDGDDSHFFSVASVWPKTRRSGTSCARPTRLASPKEVFGQTLAMQVAAQEAKLGHGKLAEELRSMIDAAKSHRSIESLARKAIPIGQPRGELAKLLQISYPKARFSDIILEDAVADRLKRIIKEQRHFARIREHGLSPRRKLLLVGPPGTGKTLTASVLAGELGLPLFLVRLDALITKYIGLYN